VNIQSGKAGVLISAVGTAMADGAKGQKINVKNLSSQRVIQEKIDERAQNHFTKRQRLTRQRSIQTQRIKRKLLICNKLVGPEGIFKSLILLTFSWTKIRASSWSDLFTHSLAARD